MTADCSTAQREDLQAHLQRTLDCDLTSLSEKQLQNSVYLARNQKPHYFTQTVQNHSDHLSRLVDAASRGDMVAYRRLRSGQH